VIPVSQTPAHNRLVVDHTLEGVHSLDVEVARILAEAHTLEVVVHSLQVVAHTPHIALHHSTPGNAQHMGLLEVVPRFLVLGHHHAQEVVHLAVGTLAALSNPHLVVAGSHQVAGSHVKVADNLRAADSCHYLVAGTQPPVVPGSWSGDDHDHC